MSVSITPMTLADYDEVYALWTRTPGLYVGPNDSRERIGAYLAQNPGMSVVARE